MRFLSAILMSVLVPFTLSAAEPAGHDHAGHDHAGHAGHGQADQPHAGHTEAETPPHGGVMKDVAGRHLELVHDAAAASLTLYVLDAALQPLAIALPTVTAQVKATGATALLPVTLKAATADVAGASAFTGSDAAFKTITAADVIVRLELDGKAQRVVFALVAPAAVQR